MARRGKPTMEAWLQPRVARGRQAARGAGEDDVVVAARGMSGGDPEAAHGTGRLALACMALKSEP